MKYLKTTFATIGAATVLVLAGNTVALATTGHSLILGQGNSADNITGVTRTTNGSALKLTTKSSASAPLTVNGKGKVTNLNADSVDGYDSTALRNRTYVFTSTFTDRSISAFNLPVSPGSYLITVSTFFNDIPSAGIQCYVSDKNMSVNTGYSSLVYTATEWHPAVTAAGYGTKSASSDIWVICNTSSGSWDATSNTPLTITATQTSFIKKTLTATIPPFRAHVPGRQATR